MFKEHGGSDFFIFLHTVKDEGFCICSGCYSGSYCDGLRQHRSGKKFRLAIYNSRKLSRWFSKIVALDVTCSHFPHILLTIAVVDNFMLLTLQICNNMLELHMISL